VTREWFRRRNEAAPTSRDGRSSLGTTAGLHCEAREAARGVTRRPAGASARECRAGATAALRPIPSAPPPFEGPAFQAAALPVDIAVLRGAPALKRRCPNGRGVGGGKMWTCGGRRVERLAAHARRARGGRRSASIAIRVRPSLPRRSLDTGRPTRPRNSTHQGSRPRPSDRHAPRPAPHGGKARGGANRAPRNPLTFPIYIRRFREISPSVTAPLLCRATGAAGEGALADECLRRASMPARVCGTGSEESAPSPTFIARVAASPLRPLRYAPA
jgi:hypothetical protein